MVTHTLPPTHFAGYSYFRLRFGTNNRTQAPSLADPMPNLIRKRQRSHCHSETSLNTLGCLFYNKRVHSSFISILHTCRPLVLMPRQSKRITVSSHFSTHVCDCRPWYQWNPSGIIRHQYRGISHTSKLSFNIHWPQYDHL